MQTIRHSVGQCAPRCLNCWTTESIWPPENAVFRCVEVTTAILPLAGALQRLAERVGRGSKSVQILDGLRATRKVAEVGRPS